MGSDGVSWPEVTEVSLRRESLEVRGRRGLGSVIARVGDWRRFLSAMETVPRPTPMYWISSSEGSSGGARTLILGVRGVSIGLGSSVVSYAVVSVEGVGSVVLLSGGSVVNCTPK